MNFWIADQSGKQCRCGSRQVGYDSGAAQVVFENQDLAKDFAEFADVMSLLLNSRRAAAPQSGARSFPFQTPVRRLFRGTFPRPFNGLPS